MASKWLTLVDLHRVEHGQYSRLLEIFMAAEELLATGQHKRVGVYNEKGELLYVWGVREEETR